jgi:hypothetical protein
MTSAGKRHFTLDSVTVEALDLLPQSKSVSLLQAIDAAVVDPALLASALARRARHEPPGGGQARCTLYLQPGLKENLEALSEQMGLSMDLTTRLALEALLVQRKVWEP